MTQQLSRVLAVALLAFGVVLPFFFGDASGFMNATIIALAYAVMSLGLNIVVGVAGLLDLGYVAFYALGAYSLGWLGSEFFSRLNVHLLVSPMMSALPGVHLVLTYADLPEPAQKPLTLQVPNPAITQLFMPMVLAKDEACYVGEPLAMVVADSRYIAEDAASLVEVDYDVLPAISDCLDAIAPGAALAHAGTLSNNDQLRESPVRPYRLQGADEGRWSHQARNRPASPSAVASVC